ncbi:MAG: hypothetical protein ACRD2W_01185 [Acidimicrobiales bacterium]
MNHVPEHPAGGGRPSAPTGAGAASRTPNLSLVVGRALGTVVVTVAGKLDLESCHRLEGLLIDLIEGQGNLAVAVDLARATIEPEALPVFIDAAHRASVRSARLTLRALAPDAHEALLPRGLAESVEILPLRRLRGR